MIEGGGDKTPKRIVSGDTASPVESLEKARLRRELQRLVDFFKKHSPYGRPLSESERYNDALAKQQSKDEEHREKEKKDEPES